MSFHKPGRRHQHLGRAGVFLPNQPNLITTTTEIVFTRTVGHNVVVETETVQLLVTPPPAQVTTAPAPPAKLPVTSSQPPAPPVVHSTPISSPSSNAPPPKSSSPTTTHHSSSIAHSATSLPVSGTATPSQGGLSKGAVGGIVTVVLLIAIGLTAFFVRKVFIRRRNMKRTTWGAGLVPALENKRDTVYGDSARPPIVVVEKSLPTPPGAAAIPSAPAPPAISPPPMSYNAAGNSPFAALQPVSMPTPAAAPAIELAVVVRTFIPTLPDELNIANGERIRVLNAYDDGWALCSNDRGEQGVVPLECLQREGAPAEMQLQPQSEFGYGSDRASKRLSSLIVENNGSY